MHLRAFAPALVLPFALAVAGLGCGGSSSPDGVADDAGGAGSDSAGGGSDTAQADDARDARGPDGALADSAADGGSDTRTSGDAAPDSASVADTRVDETGEAGATSDFTVGGARPTTVIVPPSLGAFTPAPVLILLHGYSATGAIQDSYMGLASEAAAHGILYTHPDGTVDSSGNLYWNATDACCAGSATGTPPDDVAYITGLVDEIATHHAIDRKRVFLLGHSNGGFMSHRLACDSADTFAAIVSLAGATWNDASKCKPSQPVSVLDIHGDSDTTVSYGGGTFGPVPYPGETKTIATWVGLDGCDASGGTDGPANGIVSGMTTSTRSWTAGCKAGSEVALWTIVGGPHIPSLTADFAKLTIAWLLAHPRP